MNILEAHKIRKSYGNKFNMQEVLKGIDILIEEGNLSVLWEPPVQVKPHC